VHWFHRRVQKGRKARRHGINDIASFCRSRLGITGYRPPASSASIRVRPVAWEIGTSSRLGRFGEREPADRGRGQRRRSGSITVAFSNNEIEPMALARVHHHLAKTPPGSAPAPSRTRFQASGTRCGISPYPQGDPIAPPRGAPFKAGGLFPQAITCPPSMIATGTIRAKIRLEGIDFFEVVWRLLQQAPGAPTDLGRELENSRLIILPDRGTSFRCQGRRWVHRSTDSWDRE